jgi:excisionase family DNA binding protein
MKFFTCPKAAALVGLSYHTILSAVRRGDLRAVFPNPGGHPRIPLEELERWCRSIGVDTPLQPRDGESPDPNAASAGRPAGKQPDDDD